MTAPPMVGNLARQIHAVNDNHFTLGQFPDGVGSGRNPVISRSTLMELLQ